MSVPRRKPVAQASYSYASVPEFRQFRPPSFSNQNPVADKSDSERRQNDSVTTVGAKATTSWSLSTWGLTALLLTFALLIAALLTLRFLDQHYQGLPLLTQNHYTWTYGPTAVLVIVVSFWRQIDYHCKALAPWKELQNGPVTARKSIFLDYVGPIQALTFFHAAGNRHFVVVLTISGFFLLKAITIASTGLLLPTMVHIGPRDVNLVRTTTLDGSDYQVEYTATDHSIIYTAYAVAAKNLPFVEGTNDQLVYETIAQQNNTSRANVTIASQVSAFVPQIVCQPIDAFVDLTSDEFASDGVLAEFKLNFSQSSLCPTGYASRPDSKL